MIWQKITKYRKTRMFHISRLTSVWNSDSKGHPSVKRKMYLFSETLTVWEDGGEG